MSDIQPSSTTFEIVGYIWSAVIIPIIGGAWTMLRGFKKDLDEHKRDLDDHRDYANQTFVTKADLSAHGDNFKNHIDVVRGDIRELRSLILTFGKK